MIGLDSKFFARAVHNILKFIYTLKLSKWRITARLVKIYEMHPDAR